jgi:PKD repeat protein
MGIRIYMAFVAALVFQFSNAQGDCDQLQAGFTSFPIEGGIQFSNATAGTGFQTTWLWDFGDGSTSSNAQPFHVYSGSGTYEVCLTAISIYETPNGPFTCTDTQCAAVTVGGATCAGFEVAMAWESLPNNTATFVATSNTPGTNFIWYFGDGTEAYGPTANHMYAAPGTYAVCVTGWYWNEALQDSCWTEDCDQVVVGGGVNCDQLQAGFSSFPIEGGIQFSNATTGTGFQTTWLWDFGDGSTSSNAQPFHVYSGSGTYEVCLTAISIYETPNGPFTCTDTQCAAVTVGGATCAGFEVVMAWESLPNNTVTFVATSNTPGTNFIWFFGDGTEAYGPTANHMYAAPGTYAVCVTGWYWNEALQDSCWTEDCDQVVVGGGTPCTGLEACFSALPFENGAYFFQNCSTDQGAAQFLWNFGDGSTASSINADHFFAPGTYEVCLYADWGECVDTTCTTITVGGGPACDPTFACSFASTTQGTAVILSASTTLPADGLIWYFGDGTEGSGAVVTHLYEPPGPYTVCLAAWYWNEATQDSCWAEHCQPIDPFGSVGMSDHEGMDTVRIFPVPASDHVVISGLFSQTTITLFASDGRQVLNAVAAQSTFTLPVGDLASGSYVLRLESAERAAVRRVVVE